MADDASKIDTTPIFDLAGKAVAAARRLRTAIHDMGAFVGEDVRFPLTEQDPELAAIIRDGKDSIPNDRDGAMVMLERIDQLGWDRAVKKARAAEQVEPPKPAPNEADIRAQEEQIIRSQGGDPIQTAPVTDPAAPPAQQ